MDVGNDRRRAGLPFSTYYLAALPDGPDLQVVGYGGVKVVGDGADIMTIGVFPIYEARAWVNRSSTCWYLAHVKLERTTCSLKFASRMKLRDASTNAQVLSSWTA